VQLTDDHVFPQFLGGSAAVLACKKCNDLFGGTFEAKFSVTAGAMQVLIAQFGLKTRAFPRFVDVRSYRWSFEGDEVSTTSSSVEGWRRSEEMDIWK
jgi:hypothetical protein